MKELPFRFDPFIRKICRAYEANFEVLKNFLETGRQVNLIIFFILKDEIKDEYASTAPQKKKLQQVINMPPIQKVVKT